MKTKKLLEFKTLFDLLPDVELILSGSSGMLTDSSQTELEISLANEKFDEIYTYKNTLVRDLYKEINTNLYKNPLLQREYIEDLLITFKEVVPFIDEEEYYKEPPELIFPMDLGYTRQLFPHFTENFERYGNEPHSSVELYVLNCKCLMYSFFYFLDARCIHFRLDLLKIQQEMNIYLQRVRNTEKLKEAGYRCKMNQLGLAPKALPAQSQPKGLPFVDYLRHDNPGLLAILCKQIFAVRCYPKKHDAMMLSILVENGLVTLHEKSRKEFFASWYAFIGRHLPKGNNYYSAGKHLDPYTNTFSNDTDPGYMNVKRKFESELKEVNEKYMTTNLMLQP